MRFLHTADWQIGMRAAHVGAVADRVREERLAAARRVVAAARDHAVDFLLVAGDTFENNGVDRVLVQKVADILAEAERPVFLIPGNHDPAVSGSVWDHPAWEAADHVRVLTEERPVGLPGGTLFPCPAHSAHSRRDPTCWIQDAPGDGIRIGLAHGSWQGMPGVEDEHPIATDAAQRGRLDYLALGHWHSTSTFAAPDGSVRAAYSGTHETTRFGERDSGNVLVVEIARPGDAPRVTPVRTGGLRWRRFLEEVRADTGLQPLLQKIERVDKPDATLAEICLRGLLGQEAAGDLARVAELARARFLFARIDDSGLVPAPDDPSWIEELPAGLLRDVADRLRERTERPDPEGRDRRVAARALLTLYALSREGAG